MRSPYSYFFEEESNSYHFVTDNGIDYEVVFFEDYQLSILYPENKAFKKVFQISINPKTGKQIPFDLRTRITVDSIVASFFLRKDNCLLSVCDTNDGRGLTRLNKFLRWYESRKFNANIRMIESSVTTNLETSVYTIILFHKENPFQVQIEKDFNTLNSIMNEKGL